MDVTISQEQGRVPVSVIQIAGKTDSASAEEFRIKVLEAISCAN